SSPPPFHLRSAPQALSRPQWVAGLVDAITLVVNHCFSLYLTVASSGGGDVAASPGSDRPSGDRRRTLFLGNLTIGASRLSTPGESRQRETMRALAQPPRLRLIVFACIWLVSRLVVAHCMRQRRRSRRDQVHGIPGAPHDH